MKKNKQRSAILDGESASSIYSAQLMLVMGCCSVLEESREQVERAHSALDFDTQPATICADVSIKEEVQEMEQIKVEPQHLPCTETTRTEPIDSKMRVR